MTKRTPLLDPASIGGMRPVALGNAVPDLCTARTDGTDRQRLTTNLNVSGASWR